MLNGSAFSSPPRKSFENGKNAQKKKLSCQVFESAQKLKFRVGLKKGRYIRASCSCCFLVHLSQTRIFRLFRRFSIDLGSEWLSLLSWRLNSCFC